MFTWLTAAYCHIILAWLQARCTLKEKGSRIPGVFQGGDGQWYQMTKMTTLLCNFLDLLSMIGLPAVLNAAIIAEAGDCLSASDRIQTRP